MSAVVTRAEWRAARGALLACEKAFDKQRDALAAARRALPRVRLEHDYVFRTDEGDRTLKDLFGKHPQLVVYHFMLGPTSKEGCSGCSYVADNIEGGHRHFAARDTSFVMVSRAEPAAIAAFKKRMAWTIPWVSSAGSDFNYDFDATSRETNKDRPGLSCFLREGSDVFHTYSTYDRGLDLLIATYNYLDLTPLGRHEDGLAYPMEWVRHHDRY